MVYKRLVDSEVTYTNLEPGRYVFHVKATNSDGIWTDNAVEFMFVRKPAFVETLLFKLLILALIIGVIVILFLLRIKSINAKKELITTLLDDTMTALTAAIDAKDPYTQGHSYRVSEIAQRLAKEMGFEAEELQEIKYSALLHDIGKIGVEGRILRKPGKLTEEEFLAIQQHPTIGGNILNKGSLVKYSDGAKYHHLRYNGGGYGFNTGLSGDNIPLVARIIAVADVYDALMSHRPYREGLDKKISCEIINKDSGTHLDPMVVDVFNKIVDDLDEIFEDYYA